jgi:hypothetical protein
VPATSSRSNWQVRRRWLPHRDGIGIKARFRRRGKKNAQQPDKRDRWYDSIDPLGSCEVFDEGFWIALVVIVAVVLLITVGPGLVLLGLDVLWFLGVFGAGIVARFLLGRPWSVEAVSSSGERREWKVRGFGGAGQLRDSLQAEFDAGLDPTPGEVSSADQ